MHLINLFQFCIHGSNMDSLYNQIPKRYLPVEYGGENGSFDEQTKELEHKFYSYRDYFLEEEKYVTDETKRVGGAAIKVENKFGSEGSFRKLNVD